MPEIGSRRSRWRRLLVATATGIAVVLILVSIVALVAPWQSTGDAPLDLDGNPVDQDTAHLTGTGPEPSGHVRFSVPSVGLDVPLGSMTVVDDVIVPPGFAAAYHVRDLGAPTLDARSGTVFVAVHSLRGGGVGPGNYLMETSQQDSALALGATIIVGDVEYSVTGASRVSRNRVGKTSSIWENTPGRLIVITCLQRPDGRPPSDNLVIEATRT